MNATIVVAPGADPPAEVRVQAFDENREGETKRFDPAAIEVEAGTAVTLANVGGLPHSLAAVDGSFGTGVIEPGAEQGRFAGGSATVVVTEPGTFEFICEIHPQAMQGTLVVTGDPPPQDVTTTTRAGPDEEAAQDAAAPDRATVDIVDFAFEPTEVSVAPGGEVQWTNTGDALHTATFDDVDIATGSIQPGADATLVAPDEPGTYSYFCEIHSSMRGALLAAPGDRRRGRGARDPGGRRGRRGWRRGRGRDRRVCRGRVADRHGRLGDPARGQEPTRLTETARDLDVATSVWAPGLRRLTAGLVLTVTLVAFESLAISTVMPEVSDDLGGLGLYGWVFSGFFLGSLLGIVLAGQGADRRGTRAPFVAGLVLFAAGLLVGGLAPSMPVLVGARILQGIGAGTIPAIAYVCVGREYPAILRPRVFAVFSTAWVIPGLVGPAAASAIAGWTWRAVFLALLPLVAVAGAMTIPVLRGSLQANSRREDDENVADASRVRRWAVVLIVGVALVLVGLSAGSPLVTAPLVVAGAPIAAAAFVRLVPEGTARLRPGLPAAIGARGLLTFAFFGTDAFVSLAFSEVRGQPTWVAGLALTAATITWTSGAWVQQRLVHTRGPRWLVQRGFVILAVGIAGMLLALTTIPIPIAIVLWSLGGLGVGLSYAPIAVTVLGAAPPGREGSSSAAMQLTDVLGVSLGTGLGGVFIAVGDAGDWSTATSLALAFGLMLVVAAGGAVAARRLPRA